MVVVRDWGKRNRDSCLMDIEFQFSQMKKVVAVDGGDKLYIDKNILNATKPYTFKWLTQ
jgi:hypothetical protein